MRRYIKPLRPEQAVNDARTLAGYVRFRHRVFQFVRSRLAVFDGANRISRQIEGVLSRAIAEEFDLSGVRVAAYTQGGLSGPVARIEVYHDQRLPYGYRLNLPLYWKSVKEAFSLELFDALNVTYFDDEKYAAQLEDAADRLGSFADKRNVFTDGLNDIYNEVSNNPVLSLLLSEIEWGLK